METDLDRGLQRLNSLPPGKAEAELLKCCGSTHWVRRMLEQLPFENFDELLKGAEKTWWSLEPVDWLEAFQSHPRIGEKKALQSTSTEAQRWSEVEQAGARGANQETLRQLAELNQQYEEEFGYIFIVCATGKSSAEMLKILRERLNNEPNKELTIAAGEQAQIMQLRLKRLIDSLESAV